jgi:hypothetical protein
VIIGGEDDKPQYLKDEDVEIIAIKYPLGESTVRVSHFSPLFAQKNDV